MSSIGVSFYLNFAHWYWVPLLVVRPVEGQTTISHQLRLLWLGFEIIFKYERYI